MTVYAGRNSTRRPIFRHGYYDRHAWFVELHLFGVYVGVGR